MNFVDMFWSLIHFFHFFYNVHIVGIKVHVAIYNKVHVKEGKIPCKLYTINSLCLNDN